MLFCCVPPSPPSPPLSPPTECGYSFSSGPHTTDCLTALWQEAGCHLTGTWSPSRHTQEEMAWWNDRTVGVVKDDMDLYYEYAMNGNTDYIAKCFGKLL